MGNKKQHKYDNILLMQKRLKQANNKIGLKLDELEQLGKKYENDEPTSLEKQRLIIEQSTGSKIDLKKDSVKTWVEACNIHEQIVKERQK